MNFDTKRKLGDFGDFCGLLIKHEFRYFLILMDFEKLTNTCLPKGGFFSESAMKFFQFSKSRKKNPKNYPELEI